MGGGNVQCSGFIPGVKEDDVVNVADDQHTHIVAGNNSLQFLD